MILKNSNMNFHILILFYFIYDHFSHGVQAHLPYQVFFILKPILMAVTLIHIFDLYYTIFR